MVVFVQCVLGRCFAAPVRRRTWLGLGGVLCVLGAGIAAFGINSAFGEENSVDSMFPLDSRWHILLVCRASATNCPGGNRKAQESAHNRTRSRAWLMVGERKDPRCQQRAKYRNLSTLRHPRRAAPWQAFPSLPWSRCFPSF